MSSDSSSQDDLLSEEDEPTVYDDNHDDDARGREISIEENNDRDEEIDDWLKPHPALTVQPKSIAKKFMVPTLSTTMAQLSPRVGVASNRRAIENSASANYAARERWSGGSYRLLSVDIGVRNLVLAFLDFEPLLRTTLEPGVKKKRKRNVTETVFSPGKGDGESRYRRSPWGDFVVRAVEVLDVLAEKSESETDVKKVKELEGAVSLEVACRCVWDALESRKEKFASEELDRVVIELQPGGQQTGVRNPAVAHFVLAYFFGLCGPEKVEFQSATRKLCVFFDPTFDPHRLFLWLAKRRADKKRTGKKNEAEMVDAARGIRREQTFADIFDPSSSSTSSSNSQNPETSSPAVVGLTKGQIEEMVYRCNKAFSVHQVQEILSHHGRENVNVLKFVRELDKKDDATDAILQALYYYAELRRKAKQIPQGCEKDVIRKYHVASGSAKPTSKSRESVSTPDQKSNPSGKKYPFNKFARYRKK